jgi:hypothetical protein
MKLRRPHIPLAIRVEVAERQLREAGQEIPRYSKYVGSYAARLKWLLEDLFAGEHVELHHRPALVNRTRKRYGKYEPEANDPAYLVYLPKDAHDIETRIRGQHGQHSDLALARKRKRKDKKASRHQTKWPKRAWPKNRKLRG